MIPKKSRIPRSDFKVSSREGVRTPYFSLRVKNNTIGKNRIGAVVGVAVEKSAVKRNFWKRQAKIELLKAPNSGKDILIIFSPAVKTLTKANFKKELVKAVKLITRT